MSCIINHGSPTSVPVALRIRTDAEQPARFWVSTNRVLSTGLTALMTTGLCDSDHTWPLICHLPLFSVTSLTENEWCSLFEEVKVSFIAIPKDTIDRWTLGSSPCGPMHLGRIDGPFVPSNLTTQESPVPLLKFQMTSRLKILMASGPKKEPRYTFLVSQTSRQTKPIQVPQ
jgi:hypothetical protein